MKAVALAMLLLLGSCGALLGAYMWLVRGESFVEVYATRRDASDAIARGWIPKSLPESANHIRSYGDLDVNYSFGSFQITTDDSAEFERQLVPLSAISNFRVDGDAPCAAKSGNRLIEEGFKLYRENTPDGYFIASKQGCFLFSNGI